MAKQRNIGPSEDDAQELHALVMDAMKTTLRSQMIAGDVDNALVRNILTHLKNMNIQLTTSHNQDVMSLRDAIAALKASDDED